MKKLRCHQCGSTQIATERRPDGYLRCLNCIDIPIDSQKPPFQDEPFPGYIDSLKERIDELEIALRDIAKGCYDAEGCESIARSALEVKP
jgi:hypothetical protein